MVFCFFKERINELFKICYWFLNSEKLKFLGVQKTMQQGQTLYGDAQNIYIKINHIVDLDAFDIHSIIL